MNSSVRFTHYTIQKRAVRVNAQRFQPAQTETESGFKPGQVLLHLNCSSQSPLSLRGGQQGWEGCKVPQRTHGTHEPGDGDQARVMSAGEKRL